MNGKTRMTRGTVLVVGAVILAAGTALGQEAGSPPTSQPLKHKDLFEHLNASETSAKEEPVEFVPGLPLDPRIDEQSIKEFNAALQSYFQYRVDSFEERLDVFSWQLFSSRIIFGVVIAIVAVGLFFSWMQFRAELHPDNDDASATPETGRRLHSEISVSKEGIKFSSSVLGLMILVVSLAFFYLYLVYVYPIRDTF